MPPGPVPQDPGRDEDPEDAPPPEVDDQELAAEADRITADLAREAALLASLRLTAEMAAEAAAAAGRRGPSLRPAGNHGTSPRCASRPPR